MKTDILIIGPFPLPTTGVSLANLIVLEELKKSNTYNVSTINTSFDSFDENLGSLSLKKIWFYLKLQIFVFKVFGNDIIYITPGQTFFGILKYALYIIAATLSRKRIIQHLHGNFLGKQYHLLTGVKKQIFYFLMSKTDKGIVLSESLRSNFEPFIKPENIHVLKNFVIDELFLKDEVIQTKNYNELRILYLSNLMAEKGIFDLLEALVILEKRNIPYVAKIAGNIASENKDRATNFFKKLKHTEYIGVVGKTEKTTLFTWANIFVLPTYYTMEGQPISILEAMATGTAILTTPHAGIPDIFIDGKNGYYVEAQNPSSISEVLQNLISDYKALEKIALFNATQAREEYRISYFINNLKAILK